MLASAYAPISVTKENFRQTFIVNMEYLMKIPDSNEVLLICIDATASFGRISLILSCTESSAGLFGINSVGRKIAARYFKILCIPSEFQTDCVRQQFFSPSSLLNLATSAEQERLSA
jgi:hypothetical protein